MPLLQVALLLLLLLLPPLLLQLANSYYYDRLLRLHLRPPLEIVNHPQPHDDRYNSLPLPTSALTPVSFAAQAS